MLLQTVERKTRTADERRSAPMLQPQQGNLVAEYIRPCAVVSRTHTCEQAAKRFEKYPESECIVVCGEDNLPEGLVMRDRFFRQLSRRYGADLYFERPIEQLMDAAPLTADIADAVQELIDRAMGRSEQKLYDCVVITDGGAFAGILTVADLLAMSRVLQRQAVQAEARTIRNAERLLKEIDAAVSDVRTSTAAGEELSALMVDLTLRGKTELDGASRAFAAVLARALEQERQIGELQRHAETIGNVTTLIRELADRSNLLAVNASIEAARAGEHGKGFGVVADEVRQLAAETKRSAGDIAEMIRGVLQAVERTAALVRSGREEAAAGEPAVGRAAHAFEQLFRAAADNRESARRIDAHAASAYERSSAVAAEMQALLEQRRGSE